MNRFHVTALIYPSVGTDSASGPCLMAQGLEFNVAAQGRTEHEVKLRFMGTVSDQVMLDLHNQEELPLYHLDPGPRELFHAAITAEASGPILPVWIPKQAIWWRKDRIFVYVQFLRVQESPPGGARYIRIDKK